MVPTGPRPGSGDQRVEQLDDPSRVVISLVLGDDPFTEQIHGDRLTALPQPAQGVDRMFRIGACDELTRHAADVATCDRGRHHVPERHVLRQVEAQLHGARHGDPVEVLGEVTQHFGLVATTREHVHEPEELRLEVGMRERPFEHPLAPPTEMERSDLAALSGGGQPSRDGFDLGLERVVHPSAVTQVGVAQHAHLEIGVVEEALHDVTNAHDAPEHAVVDHREMPDAGARVISIITSRTRSPDVQVRTERIITSTARMSKAGAPCRAIACTISRSVTMPSTVRPSAETTRAPMRSCRSRSHSRATDAWRGVVTTS